MPGKNTVKSFILWLALLLLSVLIGILAYALVLPEGNVPVTTVDRPDQEEPTLILNAVGDVMLARQVSKAITRNNLTYPFQEAGSFLAGADLTFANLESPVASGGERLPGKGIWFRAKPETVTCLTGAGIDVVSLANNHVLDYGSPALLETIQYLSAAGIRPVGAGQTITEARLPVIIEEKGVKVAFLAYSDMADIVWSYAHPRSLRATASLPGVAPLVPEEILADIDLAGLKADVVIISLHWGNEYQEVPTVQQRQLAHTLIDRGASIIIGHHPHVFQGIEVYGRGLIAYSLGNFLFDQDWSEATREGLLMQIKLTKAGWQEARVFPVQITACQPHLLTGIPAKKLINKVNLLSAKIGTELAEADVTGLITTTNSGNDNRKN